MAGWPGILKSNSTPNSRRVARPTCLVATRQEATGELAMSQTPFHRMFHRAIHVLPRCPKRRSHAAPRQSLRPIRQVPTIRCGQRMLAIAPRHPLDFHAARRTVHASHRVDKKHGEPPQRHILKPPRKCQLALQPIHSLALTPRLRLIRRTPIRPRRLLTRRVARPTCLAGSRRDKKLRHACPILANDPHWRVRSNC